MSPHELVGEDRLRGVRDWDDLARLGPRNAERVLRFAGLLAQAELAELPPQERRDRAAAMRRVQGLAEAPGPLRPVLPRLRVESFHVGQRVVVLLADTPGAAGPPWASGTVVAVEKSHRVGWASHPTRGYHWRVSAELDGGRRVAFTTSEPRVLRPDELVELRQAAAEDPRFVEIFAENARRPWHPLWCLEADEQASGEALDLLRWLPSAPTS